MATQVTVLLLAACHVTTGFITSHATTPFMSHSLSGSIPSVPRVHRMGAAALCKRTLPGRGMLQMRPPRQHSVALDGMMEGASYAVASEFTDSLGYAVGVLAGGGSVGYVLGLLGGGGSILALPIFLYIFQEPASTAIAESLLVRYSWFNLVDAGSHYSLNRCIYATPLQRYRMQHSVTNSRLRTDLHT
jgi:hypothetical protein